MAIVLAKVELPASGGKLRRPAVRPLARQNEVRCGSILTRSALLPCEADAFARPIRAAIAGWGDRRLTKADIAAAERSAFLALGAEEGFDVGLIGKARAKALELLSAGESDEHCAGVATYVDLLYRLGGIQTEQNAYAAARETYQMAATALDAAGCVNWHLFRDFALLLDLIGETEESLRYFAVARGALDSYGEEAVVPESLAWRTELKEAILRAKTFNGPEVTAGSISQALDPFFLKSQWLISEEPDLRPYFAWAVRQIAGTLLDNGITFQMFAEVFGRRIEGSAEERIDALEANFPIHLAVAVEALRGSDIDDAQEIFDVFYAVEKSGGFGANAGFSRAAFALFVADEAGQPTVKDAWFAGVFYAEARLKEVGHTTPLETVMGLAPLLISRKPMVQSPDAQTWVDEVHYSALKNVARAFLAHGVRLAAFGQVFGPVVEGEEQATLLDCAGEVPLKLLVGVYAMEQDTARGYDQVVQAFSRIPEVLEKAVANFVLLRARRTLMTPGESGRTLKDARKAAAELVTRVTAKGATIKDKGLAGGLKQEIDQLAKACEAEERRVDEVFNRALKLAEGAEMDIPALVDTALNSGDADMAGVTRAAVENGLAKLVEGKPSRNAVVLLDAFWGRDEAWRRVLEPLLTKKYQVVQTKDLELNETQLRGLARLELANLFYAAQDIERARAIVAEVMAAGENDPLLRFAGSLTVLVNGLAGVDYNQTLERPTSTIADINGRLDENTRAYEDLLQAHAALSPAVAQSSMVAGQMDAVRKELYKIALLASLAGQLEAAVDYCDRAWAVLDHKAISAAGYCVLAIRCDALMRQGKFDLAANFLLDLFKNGWDMKVRARPKAEAALFAVDVLWSEAVMYGLAADDRGINFLEGVITRARNAGKDHLSFHLTRIHFYIFVKRFGDAANKLAEVRGRYTAASYSTAVRADLEGRMKLAQARLMAANGEIEAARAIYREAIEQLSGHFLSELDAIFAHYSLVVALTALVTEGRVEFEAEELAAARCFIERYPYAAMARGLAVWPLVRQNTIETDAEALVHLERLILGTVCIFVDARGAIINLMNRADAGIASRAKAVWLAFRRTGKGWDDFLAEARASAKRHDPSLTDDAIDKLLSEE
ncbi:MAG: hypothetical protein WC901_00015 [Candidatus Margulisiibacteriota bacterium]